MTIEKCILNTILEMQEKLKNQINGKYSVEYFIRTGELDYTVNFENFVYIRDQKHGDHVVEGSSSVIIWTEHVADQEENTFALTKHLPEVLKEGDCFCKLTNARTEVSIDHWIPGMYLSIPKDCIGLVKHSDERNVLGYVVVVPNLI